LRITDRDILILSWLTRLGAATYADLARITGTSVEALRQRLPRLQSTGLAVARKSHRGNRPIAVWVPTALGAKVTHTGITPAPRATLTRALTLSHAASQHYPPAAIRADIEVTRALGSLQLRKRLAGHPTPSVLPAPDLLVVDGEVTTAVELVLEGPEAARDWNTLLVAYQLLDITRVDVHTNYDLLFALLNLGTTPPGILVQTRWV